MKTMKKLFALALMALCIGAQAQVKKDQAEKHQDKVQIVKGQEMLDRDMAELDMFRKNLKSFVDVYNAINVKEMERLRAEILTDMDREIAQAEQKLVADRREVASSRREVKSDQREIKEHQEDGEHKRAAGDRKDRRDDSRDLADDKSDMTKQHERLRRMREIRKELESVLITQKPMGQREGLVRVLVEEFIGLMEQDIAETKAEIQEDRMELQEDRQESREGKRERQR
jgi:hypothetical protein